MKKFCFVALMFVSALFFAYAQESSPAREYYLVPQTVFIGDRGRLVVPLGNEFAEVSPFVSSPPETPPGEEKPELVITRVELEKRNGAAWLLVDFIPYAPGVIDFPPILIPAEYLPAGVSGSGEQAEEPLAVKGLSVTIASILEPHDSSLASPAPPLAAPGTGFLVYFTAGLVIVFLALGAGGAVWGKRNLAFFGKRFRRHRLLRALDRLTKKLRAECLSGGENGAELFSRLSVEFREFLSCFSGVDCRAMTPVEFRSLRLFPSGAVKGDYLSSLFGRWEIIRFGGSEISRENFLSVLDELRGFITVLENTERAEKNLDSRKKQAAGEALLQEASLQEVSLQEVLQLDAHENAEPKTEAAL